LLKLFVLETSLDDLLWHTLDLETKVLVNFGQGVDGDLLPGELLPVVVVVGDE
jgi:hypothetical protein